MSKSEELCAMSMPHVFQCLRECALEGRDILKLTCVVTPEEDDQFLIRVMDADGIHELIEKQVAALGPMDPEEAAMFEELQNPPAGKVPVLILTEDDAGIAVVTPPESILERSRNVN